MRVLININGTASCQQLCPGFVFHPSEGRWLGEDGGVHVHLMSVRTEDTRLISRAFILASSRGPPKPGSAADAVQPTVSWSVGCSIVDSRVPVDA